MYKISVIIPVYNVENYLKRCLDSIIGQTLKDIEIICINDGSTDSSLQILQEYAKNDSRIKIINQENKGLSVTRNNGIEIAQGEFIGFVDSDDYISDNFFEELYKSAIKNNADIAVSGIKRVSSRYNVDMLVFKTEKTAENFKDKIVLCNVPDYCHVWNKIYKAPLLKDTQIRFVPDRLYEDIPFTPQILFAAKKIVTVPETYYYYWRGSSSIIKKGGQKSKEDYVRSEDEAVKFFEKIGYNFFDFKTIKIKYKLFGITLYKKEIKQALNKHCFLNCFKWLTSAK